MTAAFTSALPALSSLLSRTHLTDHEEVLKSANAALKKSKSDLEAQHVRVVALLKLDRFDDALRALEEGGNRLKERARLEWAYALYKTGRLAEAEEAAGSGGGRGIKHVLAQSTYRSEDFSRSAELYCGLKDQSREAQSEENDLRINSGAVDVQLEWKDLGHLIGKKKPAREDLEAFETAFNAACGSIARGELGQGEVLLKRARDLCEASEELTEEEKKAEILPIAVQQVYVLLRQGRTEEAEKLASSLSPQDILDRSTRHIAQVNSLAASPQSNPFLSHRLFHASPEFPKTDQAFQFQKSILEQNAYAMDLLSLKYLGVAASTASYISKSPSPTTSTSINTISVLHAAARAQNQTGKTALKQLLPLLEHHPNNVGLLLTITHLYLLSNNHGSAITHLEFFLARLEQSDSASDLDVRFVPGLVGTLVSLYALQGRKSHARAELARAATYWRHKSKPDEAPASAGLLKAAGAALLESSNPDNLALAGDLFSVLHEHDPSDRAATAGLVAAYANTDRSHIQQSDIGQLTPVARLTASIDAAALEEAGVARSAPVLANAAEASKKRPAPEKEKPTRPKKIRPSRLPKDYVEGRQLDPERWLPMRDRSYYKPKGKKGKKRAEGLTQGGISKEDERPGSGAGGEVAKVVGGGGQKKGKGKKGKR